MAKSTPVTQAWQTPVLINVPLPERDMVEPVSSERARTAYLEWQIQDMSSVRLPLNIPSIEDESHAPTDLSGRIWAFCKEWKEKRKQEWKSIKVALDKMKKSKGKHFKWQDKEEREAAYSQMVQNIERMRAMARNSISRASTISAEEQQLALTEEDFSVIKKKMDKIDQRLDDLYKNWHAEYGSTATLEECDEIKRFYKPYLEKYESKYRILYHLLQKPSLISTQETTYGITPSLATLDDAPFLRQREWIRGEPGEDVPQQYSSISGHLTPTTPRCEDMRIEPSLNVTPKGSLVDIPAAVDREKNQLPEEGLQGTSSETAYLEIPDTHVKTVPDNTTRKVPRIIQRTKEASREEAIASTQQFFAAVDRRNTNISTGSPIVVSAVVHERDDTEVPDVPTSTAATTPVVIDVEPRGTSSPRISLPEGSPSCPAVTATCRPRTWLQQITEGQTNEPTREGDSDESLHWMEM